MKHSVFLKSLAILLILTLFLTGCARTASVPEEQSSETSSVSREGEASEPQEESSSEQALTEETESSSESSMESEAEESSDGPQEVIMADISSFEYVSGDWREPTPMEVGEEATEEEAERIERAMRDYEPPSSSPLINNAKSYYYYECLNPMSQELYDTLLAAASDPSGSNYVSYVTKDKPYSQEFCDSVYLCFWCMVYDHPELYYLYAPVISTGNIDKSMVLLNISYIFIRTLTPLFRRIWYLSIKPSIRS